MKDCPICGNVYDGPFCRYGCSSADAEADVQRVLDIAYGRDEALELLNAPVVPPGSGVWRVVRDSFLVRYVPAPELSLRNLPPGWDVQRGTWSSGPYRK